MNCAEFREVLHELERPGTRGEVASAEAMAHAEGCGDCGVLLVEEESLDFALQKVARETARMPGAGRIEAALLKEFGQLKANAAMLPARNRVRQQIAALAAAAAVLLVAGATLYQRNFGRGANAQVTNVAAKQAPAAVDENTVKTSAVERAGATVQNPDAQVKRGRVGVAKNGGTSDAQLTEYATDYVPLPYADDPSALDGGSVVRVTLARSVLESYGLPAEGMGTGDRVTADMILSEDGTPQAIRLVSQAD
jgi:hypothetical protein